MGNGSLCSITGDVLTLTGVMSRLKALTCQHWWICYWWGMIPTAIVFWLYGCLGAEPRIGLALAEGLCDTRGGGGSIRLKASMIGCRRAVPLLFMPWHLPYNWGKSGKTSVRVAEQCWGLHVVSTWPPYRVDLNWPAVYKCKEVDLLNFYTCLPRNKYPNVRQEAAVCASLFGNIYICEQLSHWWR
jgi:hypothetical protein